MRFSIPLQCSHYDYVNMEWHFFVSKRSVWEKASPPSDCSDNGSTNAEGSQLRKKDIHGSQDTLYHSCWSLSDFPGNEKSDEGNEDAKSLNENLLPSNSGAGLLDLGFKWSSYGSSIHGNPVWANIPNVRKFAALFLLIISLIWTFYYASEKKNQ